MKSHYDRTGRDFRLLLDNQIRVKPRLSNLNQLAKVQHRPIDSSVFLAEVIATIKNKPETDFLSISQIYGQANILHLIAQGHLCCDLNKDISAPDNFLRIPMEADHDALLF